MNFLTGFRCIRCQSHQKPGPGVTVCSACGGNLLAEYDWDALRCEDLRRELAENPRRDILRWVKFLPISDPSAAADRLSLPVGNTPLIAAPRLGEQYGIQLQIKDDGRNPSGSLKDRASAVVLWRGLEEGANTACGASTGNAGSSMACLCAAAGFPCAIFIPKRAPRAKVAQLLLFGAKVFAVDGTYDDAYDICLEVAARDGWVNRNTGFNPYSREGKKTVSFEIAEELKFDPPDWVAVSVGDGNIIAGVGKGFDELLKVGLCNKMPRLACVQATGSNAIVTALAHPEGVVGTVNADTVADSISVDLPRDGDTAVHYVRKSDGCGVEVTDTEILAAIRELAGGTGVFAEPAGAAAWAGVRKLVADGVIKPGERVVVIATGSGLKDVDSALKVAGEPVPVAANANAAREALAAAGL